MSSINNNRKLSLFDMDLLVSNEEIEFELRSIKEIIWGDFILNPRRLRGSDFLMRWSQGVWSEKRLIDAINGTGEFYAIPYGPSGTAPEHDVREYELYFERLESAGLGQMKRPDLLVFNNKNSDFIDEVVNKLGGLSELPFINEDDLMDLLELSVIAIECENSLWVAKKMRDFGSELRPMRRLNGKPGLPKNRVLPTIILKKEDIAPLQEWQNSRKKPIHIWHVFFDMAFGISLDEALRVIDSGLIEPTEQIFQAPGGATTSKETFMIYYHYAYPLANSIEKPELVPDYIEDNNGHILPYVKFIGGRLELTKSALRVLKDIENG